MEIILASSSARRKELMDDLGIDYKIITEEVDETLSLDEDIIVAMEELSFKKALAVFKNHKDCLVIGADTMVILDGKRLGKPKDYDDAFRMLKSLSGRRHMVNTSVSMISPLGSESFSSTSYVYFYPMSDEEIEEYIKTGEPMDKAGAYGIQGKAKKFIKAIEGDYYSIMGLPIAMIYHKINKYR